MTDRPSPVPTGRILTTDEGRDLLLVRTFEATIEDVWASITEPERTARWFATWRGDPGPGKTIRYRLTFEGPDAAEADMTIEACDPPHHLAVTSVDDFGSWRLEARLHEDAGLTTLTFTHHLDDTTNAGEVGPGWEYYLDNLVASRSGGPLPDFADYFPSQKSHYDGTAGRLGGNG